MRQSLKWLKKARFVEDSQHHGGMIQTGGAGSMGDGGGEETHILYSRLINPAESPQGLTVRPSRQESLHSQIPPLPSPNPATGRGGRGWGDWGDWAVGRWSVEHEYSVPWNYLLFHDLQQMPDLVVCSYTKILRERPAVTTDLTTGFDHGYR
jgi:hypothetical protein